MRRPWWAASSSPATPTSLYLPRLPRRRLQGVQLPPRQGGRGKGGGGGEGEERVMGAPVEGVHAARVLRGTGRGPNPTAHGYAPHRSAQADIKRVRGSRNWWGSGPLGPEVDGWVGGVSRGGGGGWLNGHLEGRRQGREALRLSPGAPTSPASLSLGLPERVGKLSWAIVLPRWPILHSLQLDAASNRLPLQFC